MMQFWIPASKNDAVLDYSRWKWCSFGFQEAEIMRVDSSTQKDSVLDSSSWNFCIFRFQHAEIMQFWIPAGKKWCSFGFRLAETMQVDSNRRKWCSFRFQHAVIMQFWIPAGGNDAVLAYSRRKWRNFGCQQDILCGWAVLNDIILWLLTDRKKQLYGYQQ